MKNNKILLVMMIVGIMSSSLFAQLTDDVDVTATVVAELSLTNPVNVAFGNVSQDQNAVIDPTGASHSGVSNPTIGSLDVTGSSGAAVIVSWNTTVTLADGDNSATMTFTPNLYQGATSADAAIVNGTAYNLAAASSDIYIGGTLTVGTTQETGAYSTANTGGTPLTVDIVYQ